MKKTAFRIIPGRQPGQYRPQIGKRVFWFFWQWSDMHTSTTAANLTNALITVWNICAHLENTKNNAHGDNWKAAINSDIKP